MTDLHAKISAALDREQAQAEAATPGPWKSYIEGRDHSAGDDFILATEDGEQHDLYVTDPRRNQDHIAAQDPARTLRRVEADRRVLGRHSVDGWGMCDHCDTAAPCGDARDLAARYDVETSR